MKSVLCVILGGGRGTRLYPLTKYRAKPAVPLAGKYRLIDIPISNCLNSGFHKIFVLTQFNSESLNKHIFRTYKFDSLSGGFVEIIAAEQSMEQSDWFQGSADAVRKCLKHFNDTRFKYVLILSGDQLYKMNLAKMFDFHVERQAEVTIACNVVNRKDTPELGIMSADKHFRIKDFLEKPGKGKDISKYAVEMHGKEKFLASMGIYLFSKDALSELLSSSKGVDFGKEVIPDALKMKKTVSFIYDGYWKDIGSIDSFYHENMAFTSCFPPVDLFDEEWQIFTRPRYLPLSRICASSIESSNVAEGAIIDEKVRILRSIIGLRSRIRSGSHIEDSIIMGNDYYDNPFDDARQSRQGKEYSLGIGKNCVIKKAIIDKNVKMGDNVKIVNQKGLSELEDEYCVIKNGIVIVPKNTVIPSGTVI